MTVAASKIFEFLTRHPSRVIDRYEIQSVPFRVLRRNVRAIFSRLYEGGEDIEGRDVADMLRARLSEWLTVPVPFDASVQESLAELGDPKLVEVKWGRDVRLAYDLAYRAANDLSKEENPARVQIRTVIEKLRAEGRSWRIYCHRSAVGDFQSISQDVPIPIDAFLHSVSEYREAEPFDVLIKMGPLRARGYGAAPDALISAPRFETLKQIVWSGCSDEEEFGFDPAAAIKSATTSVSSAADSTHPEHSKVSWKRNTIKAGAAIEELGDLDIDELAYFSQLNRSTELRKATLAQLDDESGIFYPRHAEVASFDPSGSTNEPISNRIPGDTLVPGLFVLMPVLDAADFGGAHSGDGHYSRVWKQKLKERRENAPNDLVRRLNEGGIKLRNLSQRVQRWCRPATTVIHAPQTRRHFEILIDVLGIEHDPASPPRSGKYAWWEYAWSEIARSRGEAIQTGMQEHEIVYEELFVVLNEILPELRRLAQNNEFFEIPIPPNKPLQGAVRFYRIRSLEDGYLVPDTMLKVISDLDGAEQWRA